MTAAAGEPVSAKNVWSMIANGRLSTGGAALDVSLPGPAVRALVMAARMRGGGTRARWAHAPGASAAETVQALLPKLDLLPGRPSAALIRDWLRLPAFEAWMSAPQGWHGWPMPMRPPSAQGPTSPCSRPRPWRNSGASTPNRPAPTMRPPRQQ